MALADEIAVMHEGRLLQMAAPESIYTRPATRAIAAFFGAPNLLDAKVREVRREAAGSLARVEGEGWEGWCAAPGDLTAGDLVTVIVRSEAIQVGAAKAAGGRARHRVDGRRAPAPVPRRAQRLRGDGRASPPHRRRPAGPAIRGRNRDRAAGRRQQSVGGPRLSEMIPKRRKRR